MFANQRDVESTKRFHAIQEQIVKKAKIIYLYD